MNENKWTTIKHNHYKQSSVCHMQLRYRIHIGVILSPQYLIPHIGSFDYPTLIISKCIDTSCVILNTPRNKTKSVDDFT